MDAPPQFPGRWLWWTLLLVAISAILFFRAPRMVLSPPLLFDDGAKVFAYFYEHRDAVQILRFKSGYLPLVGNVIGYLTVRLPTNWIPYGFAGSAFLIAVATYSLFFGRPFRRWVPSDLQRALICLLFALAPISDCFLITVSDYSLWNLLVILIFLSAIRPPTRVFWKCLHLVLCNLLVWSHPLSFVILPLVLWFALTRPEDRFFYRLLLFNLLLHQIFGVAGIITTHGLWVNHGAPATGAIHKFVSACWWTAELVPAIAFRTAFGFPSFEEAIRKAPLLVYSWNVLLLAGAAYVFRWRPRLRPFFLYLGYLVIAITFLSCFLRYEDVHGDPFAFIRYSRRYIYIQSLIFLLIYAVLLIAVFELRLASHHARLRNDLSRPFGAAWTALPLVLLCVHYFYLNTELGFFVRNHSLRASPYGDGSPANGLIVRRFFSQLREIEARRGTHQGIYLVAQKQNDWPIVVDTRQARMPMKIRFTHRSKVLTWLLVLSVLAYATRGVWLRRLRLA